jgi:homoserine acetyltransferase
MDETEKELTRLKLSGNENVAVGYDTYKLGDFELKSGEKIPDAFIAYKTFGDHHSPAVIYPTWYSGCKFSSLLESMIRNGKDNQSGVKTLTFTVK